MKRSARRAIFVGSAVVVAVAAIALVVRGSRRPRANRYETAEITRGPIEAKVTATGTLNPLVQVQVGTQVSGTISALGADFNSVVHRGQMIAQIDPRLFQAAVDQARANLTAARANVQKAVVTARDLRRISERDQSLVRQNLIARQEADTAEANAVAAEAAVKAARGQLQQAEAALKTAQINLKLTTIISPVNGIVITRNVDVGQTVAASFNAPTLFVIAETLQNMQVDTSIAEADVGRLERGMVATFRVDAYPSETFQGAIREVRNSPQTVQNVVTYDAVIDVPNADGKLKPGMTANVTIVYANVADAVRVPNAALRFRPAPPRQVANAPPAKPPALPPGHKLVYVLGAGGQPAPVLFAPGASDGTWTEVVSGDLRAGQRVVTEELQPQRAGGRIL